MSFSTAILAYLGPETMLPMTSVVAGVAGVMMLLGRRSIGWALRAIRGLFSWEASPQPGPALRPRKIGNGPISRIGSKGRARVRN